MARLMDDDGGGNDFHEGNYDVEIAGDPSIKDSKI